MIRWLSIVPVMALTACATAPPSIQTVKVMVPVRCKAETPTKPAWPTDAVAVEPRKTFGFRFSRAAMAEIELRDGYERRLEDALKSCQ